ncbi:hypothetical protein BDZ94DRAFT_1305359 [Collybia nuda]|uniref:Uncharacterized protein n=1 Tax=Collybia nuda TaxID=64659 RepID=A0A9P5YEN0_9AGAR|nr:hypothetical protein BDZ94DRAFT_1305359 [Collybia nuda]
MTSKESKPIPLEKSLRDLALLRASDIDVASLLPVQEAHNVPNSNGRGSVDLSVERSFEFAREARLALKMYNRDEVEKQGGRVEAIRGKLEDFLSGLPQAK